MNNLKNAIDWSDKIFQFLMDKRKEGLDVTFWVRKQKSDTRLQKGLWFNGTEKYISVGFSKRDAGDLSTRSMGFNLTFDKNQGAVCKLEILFRNEKDQKLIDVYLEIINKIKGFVKNSETHYSLQYTSSDVFDNLNIFLKDQLPIMYKVVTKMGVESLMFLNEIDFNRSLNALLIKRAEMKIQPNLLVLQPLIDAFEKWYNNDQHSINVDFYKDTVTKEHLSNLNKNDCINFFLEFTSDGGKIQSGGYRTTPLVENTFKRNYSRFRQYLLAPFDTDFNMNTWLEGVTGYKGFGSGIATIYLNRIDKTRYSIVNQKSIDAFKKLGYSIKSKLTDQYQQINEASAKLIQVFPELSNFYKTDALTHFIIAEDEGIRILNDLLNGNKSSSPMKENALNQILYGPPGTGKTYFTVNRALQIVDPEFYAAHNSDRSKLTKRYKELIIKDWDSPKGQIAFCTFHQSFSYEDFVEGIKPKTTETKSIYYDIEDGIFKNICRLSEDNSKVLSLKTNRLINWDDSVFKKGIFYKLSLGDIHNPDDIEIYDYCIENNYISIGFGGGVDFSNLSETGIRDKCKENELQEFDSQALKYFIKYLKVGDYVIISKGNRYVRALARVTGEYEFIPDSPIQYNNFRKVDWIFINEEIPIEEIYNRNLSQMSIYKLDKKGINKSFFVNGQVTPLSEEDKQDKNYVLIIDEINRGNVSSIFGELITLIEKDKRTGENEELTITLPYSKTPFSVPKNVHIIGTMNTADRSIEALDTALRRRFTFFEKEPKPELVKHLTLKILFDLFVKYAENEWEDPKWINVEKDLKMFFSQPEQYEEVKQEFATKFIDDNDILENIDYEVIAKFFEEKNIQYLEVDRVLESINQRIEKLLDKDHKIGHSYFMTVNSYESLTNAFRDKVIPLLEEYFYGDFGKIGLVLGNDFVQVKNEKDNGFSFAKFNEYDKEIVSDLKSKKVYEILDSEKWIFRNIYNTSTD